MIRHPQRSTLSPYTTLSRSRVPPPPNKSVPANKKIRSVHHSVPRREHRFVNRRQMLVPTRRAANRADAQGNQTAQISRRGIGSGEFHGRIDALQEFRNDRRIMEVVSAREFGAHIKAILGRKLGNQSPHLSVAYDGEPKAHAALLPVVSNCVVMRV